MTDATLGQLVEDLERYYLINDYRFVRAAIETYVTARIAPYRQGLEFIAEHGRHSFDREQARSALSAGLTEAADAATESPMTDEEWQHNALVAYLKQWNQFTMARHVETQWAAYRLMKGVRRDAP